MIDNVIYEILATVSGDAVAQDKVAGAQDTPGDLQVTSPRTYPEATVPMEQGISNYSHGAHTGQYYPSPDNSIDEEAAEKAATSKTVREGRRLKGGLLRRLALPLLILLGVKVGLGLPILFGGVALAAFKGLWTGSTALVMTAAMALRGLIPPPKVIVAAHGHHAHVTDYLADYKRADDYRDDYGRYSYGWK